MLYRCFFTGTDGHFHGMSEILALTDGEALERAREALTNTGYAGFDLWQGERHIAGEQAPVLEESSEASRSGLFETVAKYVRRARDTLALLATADGIDNRERIGG